MFFKAFLSFILSPLVLLLGTSSAFAAESCRLFVSTPVDQTALSRLGYKVQVSPGLTDGIISLRTHTDQGFAFIRTAAQDHLYFEIDDSAGNRPILRLTYPAKGLVSCKAVQARMEKLRQDRLQILPAVRYLKSPDNASFLEAVLALEKRAFALKGKPFEMDREWLGRVLSLAARDGLARGTDFFLRLNQMRASLIRNALSSYCREKTTLAELSTDK